MLIEQKERIPAGPVEDFNYNDQDLLQWMERNFAIYGDIFKANVFGTNVYVVSLPEHAEHVLRHNWENYKKGQAIKRVALLLGSGLMVSEGEFWKQQRRMVQPAFTHGFVSGFYGVMKDRNQALLEKWNLAAKRNECVNLTSDLSLMVLEVTLRAIFGADYPAIAPFFSIVHDDPARNLQFAQKFTELRNLVLEIVERRRNRVGATDDEAADILGRLMQARDPTGKPMPDNQLVNEIMTIVVAGHETTASTLNMTWWLLSQNVKVERRLAAELEILAADAFPGIEDLPAFSYTRGVIDEALRLYPAGWLLTRRAKKDDRLGDYFVPAGTEIYISPYMIHRHPDFWVDPRSFRPERFDRESPRQKRSAAMLPFSAGPRNCIGEFFARTEMQVHLMIVARRIRMRYTQERPPEFEAGVNLRARADFVMWPEAKAA